jgi:mono/diheme cytochrome c family protein
MADGQPSGTGLARWLLGGLLAGGVLLGLLVAAFAVGRHTASPTVTRTVTRGVTGAATAPATTAAPATPTRPAEAGDAAAGKTVFAGTCSGCHAQNGTAGGGVGPKLAGLGLSAQRIESQITNPVGSMPANLVSGTDLTNVVAYVVSIQR